MAPRTFPPDLPVGAGQDLVRGHGPVFGLVPLGGQVWVSGGQVIFPGRHLLPGADRTLGVPGTPGLDHSLPAVALLTDPPGPEATSAGNGPGRFRKVPGFLPLGQQMFFAVETAKLIKTLFFHIFLREEGGQWPPSFGLVGYFTTSPPWAELASDHSFSKATQSRTGSILDQTS